MAEDVNLEVKEEESVRKRDCVLEIRCRRKEKGMNERRVREEEEKKS